eukprot:m.328808 g.328808  ORF g.328808 m.328808 type:complete len:620 (-) comp16034_c3_seq18:142-2001(-)
MSSELDEFREEFVRLFDVDAAQKFNEALLCFLTDQKLRTFVSAVHTLCQGERVEIIGPLKQTLPATVQSAFQNAWDLIVAGIVDPEAPDDKVEASQCNVLYHGSGGLLSVPSQENPGDMEILNTVLRQMLEESEEEGTKAELRIAAGSIQTIDLDSEASIVSVALSIVVFMDVLDIGEIDDEEETAFVIVQQDPIYELVVAHFYSCPKNRALEFFQLVQNMTQQTVAPDSDPFHDQQAPSVPATGAAAESFGALEFDRNVLTHKRGLGAGQFGMVYLAACSDPAVGHDEVAVKTLRQGSSQDDTLEFTHEAEIMQTLSHKNVLKLLGVSTSEAPMMMILEFVAFGNVRHFLQRCIATKLHVTSREQLHICHQLAIALEYIHAQGIVHMDIAARNVLLGSQSHIKLADFGQAHRKGDDDVFVLTQVIRLSVRWMAPETLASHRKVFGELTDVWSFAVTCWEVFMYGRMPFRSLKTAEARDLIMAGKACLSSRPVTTCPKPMWALLEECWSYDQPKRPTFTQVVTRIASFLEAVSDEALRDLGETLQAWEANAVQQPQKRLPSRKPSTVELQPGSDQAKIAHSSSSPSDVGAAARTSVVLMHEDIPEIDEQDNVEEDEEEC